MDIFRKNTNSFLVFPLVVICWLAFLISAVPVCLADVTSDTALNTVVQMKEVVVSGTRYETPKQDIAANITVFTQKDLEKLPVSNAAEALQYIPGVYMEFNGGPGSFAAGVRIQGSETRHVAIYQDGVPLNQLANPLTDLSYIPIDTVQRIEVYKGAASSAWGSALGGVVNIITKEPDPAKPFTGDVRTSYGKFQTSKSRGSFSGTKDRFGYLVSVTHDQSDGFIDHTKYRQDAIYSKLHYDVGDAGRLSFVYAYDEGENEDPVLNFPQFWDDMNRKRSYQRLLFETEIFENWELSIEGRHHLWDIFIEDVYPDRREIYNDYTDEIWGGGARLTRPDIAGHTVNVGFDGNAGRYDWQSYDRTYHTNNWALYANDTVRWGAFSFNAGLRHDYDNLFGGETSPSGGVVYHILEDKARIRLQIAKGFSAPPASWVQDPNYGNPDLKAETAINYQLGAEIRPKQGLRIEVNLFRSDVDNLLRYNLTTRRFENLDQVVRQGVEGNVTVALPYGLTVSAGGSYTDVRDKQTDTVIQDIPRTLYTLQLAHSCGRLTHTLTGTYIDHNSSYPETRDKVFIFNYRFDIKLPAGKFKLQPSLFGAVYNITNTRYIYREVWPQPERWAEVGVRVEF